MADINFDMIGPSDIDIKKIGTDGISRTVKKINPDSKPHLTTGERLYPVDPNNPYHIQNEKDLATMSTIDTTDSSQISLNTNRIPDSIFENQIPGSRLEIMDIYKRINKNKKYIYIIILILSFLIIFLIIYLTYFNIEIYKKIKKISTDCDNKINLYFSTMNKKIDTVTKGSVGNII